MHCLIQGDFIGAVWALEHLDFLEPVLMNFLCFFNAMLIIEVIGGAFVLALFMQECAIFD